jgi:hypothetical protein
MQDDYIVIAEQRGFGKVLLFLAQKNKNHICSCSSNLWLS